MAKSEKAKITKSREIVFDEARFCNFYGSAFTIPNVIGRSAPDLILHELTRPCIVQLVQDRNGLLRQASLDRHGVGDRLKVGKVARDRGHDSIKIMQLAHDFIMLVRHERLQRMRQLRVVKNEIGELFVLVRSKPSDVLIDCRGFVSPAFGLKHPQKTND